MTASDNEKSRLDEAGRAGWLYFIAGHTQDEIAKMLKVSRASSGAELYWLEFNL